MHQISPKLLQFRDIENKINEDDFDYLIKNYNSEFEYFRAAMILRGVHSISMLNNKENKQEVFKYIKQIEDKEILKNIIRNKYSNKAMKIEVSILLYLGVNMHLFLTPIYKYMRKKIRR